MPQFDIRKTGKKELHVLLDFALGDDEIDSPENQSRELMRNAEKPPSKATPPSSEEAPSERAD